MKKIFWSATLLSISTVFCGNVAAQYSENRGAQYKFTEERQFLSEQEYLADRHRGKQWVYVDSEGIKFYGKDGVLQKKIIGNFKEQGQMALGVSRSRRSAEMLANNSGVLVEERSFSDFSEASTATWTIYNAAGKEQGKIRDSKFNGFLKSAPNGRGHILSHWLGEGYGMDNKMEFFDAGGKKLKEEAVFDWVGDTRIVYSDDGAYAVCLHEGSGKGGMAIFDPMGNVLAKYAEVAWLPIGPGDISPGESEPSPNLRISPEARVVVIEDKKGNLMAVDFNGRKLWSINYNDPINIAISNDGKRLIVFEIGKNKSRYSLLNTLTGQVITSADIDLYRAPAIPGKPEYMEEKPWAYFKTMVLNDRAVLTYVDARRKNAKTICGAQVFDFNGNNLSDISWEKPERIIKEDGAGVLVVTNGEIKRWRLDLKK